MTISLANIPEHAQAHIRDELNRVEKVECVRILFAIESGSRAWGFASPDSDYDVRFVYVREPDWYLSLTPKRDVIEVPLTGDFDTNGWDIRKALNLLLKPNPVLLEWLSSPIRYRWNQDACAQLQALACRTAFARACLNHYASVARRHWNDYVEGREDVNLKKYLYILRPAMSLAWIREQPTAIPPMSLPHLMQGVALHQTVRDAVAELLALKSQASELGRGPRLAALDEFITRELSWAATQDFRAPTDGGLREEAEKLFRSFVRQGR